LESASTVSLWLRLFLSERIEQLLFNGRVLTL